MTAVGDAWRSPDDLPASFFRACAASTEAVEACCERIAPGVSPKDLVPLADRILASWGAEAVLRGIGSTHGLPPFPDPLCVSVNDVAVNGVPRRKPLQRGDVVTVDVACAVEGWHADHATTVILSEEDPEPYRPAGDVFERVLGAIRFGEPVERVHAAYESACRAVGGHPVEEAVLHGIGRALHGPPTLLAGRAEPSGARYGIGMLLAVEPVVADRHTRLETLADGWSRRLVGSGVAGYEERTVFIGVDGPVLLTGPQRFRGLV